MRTRCLILVFVALLGSTRWLAASGPIGIYGIVERVVFEPNEAQAERVQVWGAFAVVEEEFGAGASQPARGYLYFRLPTLPDRNPNAESINIVRREWADLKAMAGTGQAIGFGSWWGSARRFDLRVRPASEGPESPSAYQTNAGVVKITDNGSHAKLVRDLRAALQR